MAATSHDYWLVFLTPPVWKGLHMALYVAYGLVVMHVALGVMQYDRNPFIPAMLASGFAYVTVLHLVAGWRERSGDRAGARGSEGWLSVGGSQFQTGAPASLQRRMANASQSSATGRRSGRSRIFAPTSMGRLAKGASSTAA
jgi:DMSO/TMAO reductase YedYZ heme-binding membrane subunit